MSEQARLTLPEWRDIESLSIEGKSYFIRRVLREVATLMFVAAGLAIFVAQSHILTGSYFMLFAGIIAACFVFGVTTRSVTVRINTAFREARRIGGGS